MKHIAVILLGIAVAPLFLLAIPIAMLGIAFHELGSDVWGWLSRRRHAGKAPE